MSSGDKLYDFFEGRADISRYERAIMREKQVLREMAERQVNPPLTTVDGALRRIGMMPELFAPYGAEEKKVKKDKRKLRTIGVRFPETPAKIYTYLVAQKAKVHLGQELVADTPNGTSIVFVVRIDNGILNPSGLTLKEITRKAATL